MQGQGQRPSLGMGVSAPKQGLRNALGGGGERVNDVLHLVKATQCRGTQVPMV